jgi:hypothetical protein
MATVSSLDRPDRAVQELRVGFAFRSAAACGHLDGLPRPAISFVVAVFGYAGAGRDNRGGRMSKANPIEVQKYLSGVDYPAARDDLVRAAESNGADSDTLDKLRGLPDRSYEGPSGVSKDISREG